LITAQVTSKKLFRTEIKIGYKACEFEQQTLQAFLGGGPWGTPGRFGPLAVTLTPLSCTVTSCR